MQANDFGSLAQQVFTGIGTQPWLISLPLLFIALVLMLLVGNPLIEWLRNKQWKKGTTADETWAVREDTPDTHQTKKGTPSMGGIGIITATLLSHVVLLSFCAVTASITKAIWGISPLEIWTWMLLMSVFLLHGMLGFADDWSKASGRGGLRARSKLFGQILLASAFVAILPSLTTTIPITNPDFLIALFSSSDGALILVGFGFLIFVVIATSNAVNLTDGIDGLAAGLAVQCGFALMLLGYGQYNLPVVAAWFWAALAGACLGFLKFNRYKARVFMGDTGSLAIGAALGAGAILQGAVLLLPFIGFIYFVEMFSVIAQVLWFKWTKRKTGEGQRLFRRAPLHHHFEMCGWSEWRVVGTFWAVNLFTSAIGLWLWHAGVLPRWP